MDCKTEKLLNKTERQNDQKIGEKKSTLPCRGARQREILHGKALPAHGKENLVGKADVALGKGRFLGKVYVALGKDEP